MNKKGTGTRRPIDQLREGAGCIDVETPDDGSAITGFISLKERLFIIKELGIYEIKLADQLDPERKNINAPNTVQRILPYGSNQRWVGAVVLTGSDLLKSKILDERIDTEKAMNLVIDIAQNIASAFEIAENVSGELETELNKYDPRIKSNRSFVLPAMKGIGSRSKEFFQKSDHALGALLRVVQIFYPEIKKGSWKSLKDMIDQEVSPIDNFKEVLAQRLPLLLFVRNARNCVEHPRNEHKVIVKDFCVDAENNLLPPSIEVIHPKTPQSPVPIAEFMSRLTDNLVGTIEIMLASLCNRHIRPIQGLPVQVYELPENRRPSINVRYGYGVETEDSIAPFSFG